MTADAILAADDFPSQCTHLNMTGDSQGRTHGHVRRCDWAGTDRDYIAYHDSEWGVPCLNDRKLFEMLILEGAQAGLSWITILKKRPAYRRAFDRFDAEKMARYNRRKIELLMNDAGIVRNRLKIESAVDNARAYLDIREREGSFSDYIWQFVDGRPVIHEWKSVSRIPARSRQSEAMSRALKKRGFRFVGATICYAFMQSVGLVNDHITTCFRYREIIDHHGA